MKQACVIGWPISHSRSPMIHNYWIRQIGFDATYTKRAVEPKDVKEFIHGMEREGLSGCNVTIPHKETVYHLVTIADESTVRLGAVNTVYLRDGTTYGTNTDGEGFLSNLLHQAPKVKLRNGRAVILGAGGAAAAIADVLRKNGMTDISLINRSVDRAAALGNRLGGGFTITPWDQRSDALVDCDLLVNTTSLGMTGQPPLDIDLHHLPTSAAVADIVYSPLRTALLKSAEARDNTTVEGLGMLLHQAVRGFELWFGVRPAVTPELHDLVARDIDPDYGT